MKQPHHKLIKHLQNKKAFALENTQRPKLTREQIEEDVRKFLESKKQSEIANGGLM